MSKNLVIVESPAKAKTIEKFLGGDFEVKSSYGHVRDLVKSEMSIDIDNNFEGVCFEIDRIVSERVGERMKVFSDPSVGCADISPFRGDKTDYN